MSMDTNLELEDGDLGASFEESSWDRHHSLASQEHDEYFRREFRSDIQNEENKKKKTCSSCLKAIWATRHKKNTMDKQELIKTTIRDLIIYFVFLTLIMTIALVPTIFLKSYFYTDIVQQFTTPLNISDSEAFEKIKNQQEMWNYIRGGMLNALYYYEEEQMHHVLDNSLVGRPRIRQIRVQPTDCHIPEPMLKFFGKCLPNYTPVNEEKKQLTPRGGIPINVSTEAWSWRSNQESQSQWNVGTMATYSGSGYYIKLSLKQKESAQILEELFQGLWTDGATRAIFIDFTMYNANLNLFCICQILFEIPYTGGVISSSEFRPLYLLRKNSITEYAVFICEILTLFFVFYYTFKECYEMKKLGLAYFTRFSNLLDFFVISLSITCVVLSLYRSVITYMVLKGGIQEDLSYPQFENIGYWSLQYNRMLALLVFSALIQIFKFMSFSETMGQLTATLNYAIFDMIGFTVMFGIVFMAFVQAGTLMFGRSSEEFKKFDMTAFVLYRIILGDFDMEAIKEAHIILGPLYFIIYIFFVFFVLLNMFLAIIGEAYTKVKEDMKKRKNDFKLIGYIKHSTNQWFRKLRKEQRIPLDKVLETAGMGERAEITFTNFRRAMKCAGYSEIESSFLFNKYDKDRDNVLDFLERRRIREDMTMGTAFQVQELNQDKEEENDEKKNIENFDDMVADKDDCDELLERIEETEANVNQVVQQICLIVGCMEQTEKARRDMERSILNHFI